MGRNCSVPEWWLCNDIAIAYIQPTFLFSTCLQKLALAHLKLLFFGEFKQNNPTSYSISVHVASTHFGVRLGKSVHEVVTVMWPVCDNFLATYWAALAVCRLSPQEVISVSRARNIIYQLVRVAKRDVSIPRRSFASSNNHKHLIGNRGCALRFICKFPCLGN